jgi:DNA-binding LytR/AlgR family response regulator
MRQSGPMFSSLGADRVAEPSDMGISEPLTIEFRQRVARRSTNLGKVLPQAGTLTAENGARIAIKSKGKILFMHAADLIAIEAKGNYVLLSHTSGSYTLRESISIIEKKLHLHGFVRIHRSVLVNAALVEEIHPCATGDYMLRVRGGRQFTVTRTYKNNLQFLAQLWIGIEGFTAR